MAIFVLSLIVASLALVNVVLNVSLLLRVNGLLRDVHRSIRVETRTSNGNGFGDGVWIRYHESQDDGGADGKGVDDYSRTFWS